MGGKGLGGWHLSDPMHENCQVAAFRIDVQVDVPFCDQPDRHEVRAYNSSAVSHWIGYPPAVKIAASMTCIVSATIFAGKGGTCWFLLINVATGQGIKINCGVSHGHAVQCKNNHHHWILSLEGSVQREESIPCGYPSPRIGFGDRRNSVL